MKRYLFYFSLIIKFTSYSNNIYTLKIELEKISQSTTSSLDSQIKHKHKELISSIQKIKTHKKYLLLLEKTTELKKATLYKRVASLQKALILLKKINDHSSLVINPYLLQETVLLINTLEKDDVKIKSFLQKQRAYLMDNSDEAITLHQKKRKIADLKKEILTVLPTLQKKLSEHPLYLDIKNIHSEYSKEKVFRITRGIIQKIIALRTEKEILILKNRKISLIKTKINLLENKLPTKNTLICKPIINNLNWVYQVQLDLFLAPIETILL